MFAMQWALIIHASIAPIPAFIGNISVTKSMDTFYEDIPYTTGSSPLRFIELPASL